MINLYFKYKLNRKINLMVGRIGRIKVKGPFPLRAWKRAFSVSFIDLRLKRAQKKINRTNKECSFPRS